MTAVEIKKAERIASESEALARRALAKSDQVHAYLSLLEYGTKKVRTYASARALVRKVRAA
jgi:hypothetical protein